AAGAGVLYWRLEPKESIVNPAAESTEGIWNAVSCRARIYLQSARGGVPELSMTELWGLMHPGRGFLCTEDSSLQASIRFSSIASEDDRKAGARIFRERCTGCHGADGSGGSVGPSLTRSQYNHGDADLAIYKVLRDGIPGTAMQSAGLTAFGRLQVIAYLRTLKADSSEDRKPGTPPLAIQVSNERLQAAGTNPDEWLTYSGSYNGW